MPISLPLEVKMDKLKTIMPVFNIVHLWSMKSILIPDVNHAWSNDCQIKIPWKTQWADISQDMIKML